MDAFETHGPRAGETGQTAQTTQKAHPKEADTGKKAVIRSAGYWITAVLRHPLLNWTTRRAHERASFTLRRRPPSARAGSLRRRGVCPATQRGSPAWQAAFRLEPRAGAATASNRSAGVLEPVQRYAPPATLEAGTAQSMFYTDNAFWSATDRRSSLGWAGNFWATWTPYSTRQWEPQIGVEYDMYRHDRVSAADYDAGYVFLGSRLYLDRNRLWAWNADYSLWRYQSCHPTDVYLKHGWLRNGITWTPPLDQHGRLYFLGTCQFAWQHAQPSAYDRVEATLLLSLQWYVASTVWVQPFVVCEGLFYTRDNDVQEDRCDFRVSPGISAKLATVSLGHAGRRFLLARQLLEQRLLRLRGAESFGVFGSHHKFLSACLPDCCLRPRSSEPRGSDGSERESAPSQGRSSGRPWTYARLATSRPSGGMPNDTQ